MAYHTEADIEKILQIDINTNTAVTTAQCADIIAETDATINSKLADKYQLPITGSDSLLVIRRIATKISAGEIQRIFGFNYQRGADEETKERVPQLLSEGRSALNALVNGTAKLTDAILVSKTEKVSSSYDAGLTSQSSDTDFGSDLSEDKY